MASCGVDVNACSCTVADGAGPASLDWLVRRRPFALWFEQALLLDDRGRHVYEP
jgi:hypothetical protein